MSRIVFVGNLPYDMTEEQLTEVFSSVGPVAGFRLVFDRESGKAKGFGFCEFFDHETAKSAVRNLNGQEVKGRPLRIDLADEDPRASGSTSRADPDAASRAAIPPGVPVPPGSTALDAISNVIATIRPAQLMEVMGHMKALVLNHPEQARSLLTTQPQLAYALFQAMLMNRIVDPSVLQRMLAATATQPTAAAQPPSAPKPVPQTQTQPSHFPTFGFGPPPPQSQPTQPPAGPSHFYAANTQPAQAAPPPPVTGDDTELRKAMIMQVLQLTPAQIEALPPTERVMIQQLRSQLVGAGAQL